MAKGIKELTALEAVNPGLLFETVGAVADSEGIYARKADFSALESFAADKSRGNAAPVVKLAGDTEAAAKAHTDAAVVTGKDESYFAGLPDSLKNGAGTSVVNALGKEYGRATGAEDALDQAVRDETAARVEREGAGNIPVIGTAAPVNFIAAFGDVVTRFEKTEQRDDEQTAGINALRNDYSGPDGLSGFKKEVADKIGDMGDLPHSEDSLAKNIAGVFETANRPLVTGDEFAGAGTAASPLEIADGSVTAGKLAVAAIDGATGELANGAVTGGKIAEGSVTAGKLAVAAIDSATGELAEEAVTGSKIADGAVTAGKLAEDVVTLGKLADGLGDGGYKIVIADGAITLEALE
jgi:hypothetical protein